MLCLLPLPLYRLASMGQVRSRVQPVFPHTSFLTLSLLVESYCIPNFDSPSVFARILDKDKVRASEPIHPTHHPSRPIYTPPLHSIVYRIHTHLLFRVGRPFLDYTENRLFNKAGLYAKLECVANKVSFSIASIVICPHISYNVIQVPRRTRHRHCHRYFKYWPTEVTHLILSSDFLPRQADPGKNKPLLFWLVRRVEVN